MRTPVGDVDVSGTTGDRCDRDVDNGATKPTFRQGLPEPRQPDITLIETCHLVRARDELQETVKPMTGRRTTGRERRPHPTDEEAHGITGIRPGARVEQSGKRRESTSRDEVPGN